MKKKRERLKLLGKTLLAAPSKILSYDNMLRGCLATVGITAMQIEFWAQNFKFWARDVHQTHWSLKL